MTSRIELQVEGLGAVRARGLKIVRAKGKRYIYHRATGERLIGIWENDRGQLVATQSDLDEIARLNAPKVGTIPGTLRSLFDEYTASIQFRALKTRTRKDYERVIAWVAPTDADIAGAKAKHARQVELSKKQGKPAPTTPKFGKGARDLKLGQLTPPKVFEIQTIAFQSA